MPVRNHPTNLTPQRHVLPFGCIFELAKFNARQPRAKARRQFTIWIPGVPPFSERGRYVFAAKIVICSVLADGALGGITTRLVGACFRARATHAVGIPAPLRPSRSW
jgi:hypothetical protein